MANVVTSRFQNLTWLDRRWPRKFRSDLYVTAALAFWFAVASVVPDAARDVLGSWGFLAASVFAGRGVLALAVARRRLDDTAEVADGASGAARRHRNGSYWIVVLLLSSMLLTVVLAAGR